MILLLLACLTADQYADAIEAARCDKQRECVAEWGPKSLQDAACKGLTGELTTCRDDYFDPEAAEMCLEHWRDLDCDDSAHGEGYDWCAAVCVANEY